MRICIFSRSIPEHSLGGMEQHCWIVATSLAQRGHEVKLITTSSPKGKTQEDIGRLEVFYLKGTRPGKYSQSWWKKSLKVFKDLDAEFRFNIVFSESTGALSCLKARARGDLDIPIILRLPGTALGEAATKFRQGLSLRAILAISRHLRLFLRDRRWVSYSDAIITCSQEVTEAVVRELCVPKENIYTVLNGVDVDKFNPNLNPSNLREEMDLSVNTRTIMCANRLVREKGTHILLKAISELIYEDNKIRVIIIGNGRFAPALKKMVYKLNLSEYVIFKDGVAHESLPEYYMLADVFVLPTLRNEGLPWAILEAMSCGRPVIASRIGGIPSVIDDDKDGLFFTPGDISGLKEKLRLLLDNPDLRERLGQRAREKIVSGFNQETMIEETLKVLERYAYRRGSH